ncbi:MAG: hypothetical protein L7S64_09235 [Longimicrobiales bacterium]|nr:hypothetical protein [Longimicrobiales bacterium]
MSAPTRGYLTLAAGSLRYLEMAVDMALSLREHTRHPVGLVCDEATAEMVTERYPTVFDCIAPVGADFRDGRALKYGVAEASPWEEAVFVDADCLVLGTLDHAFDALADRPLAFLGELLTRDDDEHHHGFSTRRLMRTFHLDHYLKTNSGFFAFRKAPAESFMRACLRSFVEEARPRLRLSLLRGCWLGDEIAIGLVGGRHELRPLPKPAEMYWPAEFESLDPDRPTKPLLHFIWPLPERTFRALMRVVEERREAAGVPWTDADHWVAEQAGLERMAHRRRWLERLKIWR